MQLTKNTRKLITSLRVKKYRDKSGKFVVEGIKGVAEAVVSNQPIEFIVVRGSLSGDIKDLISKAQKRGIDVGIVTDKEYKGLSTFDTDPGILAVVEKSEPEMVKGDYILLDEIKDPGNLGTIIRTADWFGVKNIVLGKGCVDPFNPKVAQATMGSLFHIQILEDVDLAGYIQELKKTTISIIATSLEEGSELLEISGNFALLIGSESHGLSRDLQKLADIKYRIKGKGSAESLNVAVATGIVLEKLV